MDILSTELEQQAQLEAIIDKIKRLAKINKNIVVSRSIASVTVEIINSGVTETIDLTKPAARSLLNMLYTMCLSHTPATMALSA